MASGTGTPSELATSEMPVSELGDVTPLPAPIPTFPPYPPYVTEPAPPSVADTIIAGHDLRLQHKSVPKKPVRPPPKPARPRGPKATDVKMTKRALRAHARCLRKHGAILTDRLERMSKPRRRTIIYLWREHAYTLPPETISRLRSMLDADEPFKPDQAYEYFVNLKKTKKKVAATERVNEIKKDVLAMCGEKRFVWARNATVAFARGIQQRLSRPGRYALADGMLRLSDIILDEICGYMHMRTPSRRSTNPKAKFMMEMSDKVAVWIDEILSESDDRMLMMDFDEDEEVERFFEDVDRPEGQPHAKDYTPVATPETPMTPEQIVSSPRLAPLGSPLAEQQGSAPEEPEISPAAEPKTSPPTTPQSEAVTPVSEAVTPQSEATTPAVTPAEPTPKTSGTDVRKDKVSSLFDTDVLRQYRGGGGGGGDEGFDDFLDMMGPGAAGGLLSQKRTASSKFTGKMKEAFDILTDSMEKKGDEKLVSHGKFEQTCAEGAEALKEASDLGATEYDTKIAEKVKNKLDAIVKDATPATIARAMTDMVDICSKYLAQNAEYNKEKGPAFKTLVTAMRSKPNDKLFQKGKIQRTNAQAADELDQAKGLDSDHDDPNLSQEIHSAMTRLVKDNTPDAMRKDMAETVDTCSKYLSQKAVDELERGPAFDLLVKELNKRGGEPFSDYPAISTKHAAAYTLTSAPGLASVAPDPKTIPELKEALHKAVDTATPQQMRPEMKEVTDRCANYLSGFIRDRGPAMDALVGMMKSKPTNVFAKRKNYTMDYETAATETVNAPSLVPYLPVKDIAEEGKQNLTKDMKDVTPSKLKIPMQTLIQDVSKHLSQAVAMRSGVAGDRYPMNFLAEVKDSLGDKPLYKYKEYGQTYADAADTLKHAGPAESAFQLVSKMDLGSKEKTASKQNLAARPQIGQSTIQLTHEIASEMKRGVPQKLAPTIAEGLQPTMDKAAKHLANVGSGKGKALEHLVDLMKGKGDAPLGQLQGYDQTYTDGARRIENSPTLTNDKVDKRAYESVKSKLTELAAEKPAPKHAEHMPGMVEESAKFLSAPVPETPAEKRAVLGDLMARKEDKIIGQEGIYKMTYTEGGKDIKNAPVGAATAHDETKKKEMEKKLEAVIPDQKMAALLQEPTQAGAVHLTDAVKGRGEAMGVIQEGLKKGKEKEFIEVGAFQKTHEQTADMLAKAPNFTTQQPSPVILEKVEYELSNVPKEVPPGQTMAMKHIDDASKIASKYIAGVATKDSGLTAEELAALDEAGFNADAKAAAEARRKAAIAAGPGSKITEAGMRSGAQGALAGEDESAEGAGKSGASGKKAGAGAEGADLAASGAGLAAGKGGVAGEGMGPGGAGMGPGGAGMGPGGAGMGPGGAGMGPGGAGTGPGGAGTGPGGAGTGPGGAGYGPGGAKLGPDGSVLSETEEQRRRRLAEAEAYKKHEEEQRRRLGDTELFKRLAEKKRKLLGSGKSGSGKYKGGALGADYDPEHEAALDILHRELQSHGTQVFYEQPQTTLTHAQASDWLAAPSPMRVDKSVKDSSDTTRLHKKFEKKLNALVSNVTPADLADSMQDVIIESARRLSEFFVATNYKVLVREGLISEMQKRGNEIFTEIDGAAETFFFAAQRLKKTNTLAVRDPCYQVAHQLLKKLDDIVRNRSMPRKLASTMKEHTREAADYLSGLVTKPDDQIEAYVALLEEMEAAGDTNLISGDIPKSHKDAAAYLRQLTSFEDQIRRPNPTMHADIKSKLKNRMSNVPPSGYSTSVMDTVIGDSAGLLVSYIMLQGEKTEALKFLLREIEWAGDCMLLRHGPIRKSFNEAADLLRGKTADQLSVPSADPVVARKIQIRLNNLMSDKIPEKYQAVMDDVIEDATMYLAVQLLQPKVIKVCKCMKNVFVQCELWSDQIFRHVERPCCTCSRHVSAQALQDLAPTQRLFISPGQSRVFAPGLEISITNCPSKQLRTTSTGGKPEPPQPCPAIPTPGCSYRPTTSYLLYSTTHKKFGYNSVHASSSPSGSSYSPELSLSASSPGHSPKRSSPFKTLMKDIHSENVRFFEQQQMESFESETSKLPQESSPSYFTPDTHSLLPETIQRHTSNLSNNNSPTPMFGSPQTSDTSGRITQAKSGYSSRTPISTDQMADWHAMMVSLMWNVQAWRDWIQENIDRALAHQRNPIATRDQTADNWTMFQRRVSTEALQWRQYSIFSRQLTARLILRYKDKEMVSPNRSPIKTKMYLACLEEMLDIIDMFNRWTQWLSLVIKETDSLQDNPASDISLHELRWNHLKKKAEDYSNDWVNYNRYLKVSWEQKYSKVIAEYLPSWKEPGPVWVVSACGAVPSGAVAAGVHDGEVTWVARTTHGSNVLPAALYPSKHCCVVYAEGAVHRYTKYQVMCNADVRWVAWRGGGVGSRAVRVAAGAHVGRVHYRGDHLLGAVLQPHYRCHVVIFGRPFAFNCYELLVLAGDD